MLFNYFDHITYVNPSHDDFGASGKLFHLEIEVKSRSNAKVHKCSFIGRLTCIWNENLLQFPFPQANISWICVAANFKALHKYFWRCIDVEGLER